MMPENCIYGRTQSEGSTKVKVCAKTAAHKPTPGPLYVCGEFTAKAKLPDDIREDVESEIMGSWRITS